MPCAHRWSVTTAVAEDDLAASVGDEFPRVRLSGGLCAGSGYVQEIDVLDEAWAGGYEVAHSLLDIRAVFEGVSLGWHEDADIPCTAAADVETRQILACFRVDDTVPGLVSHDAARAGLASWWWAGHLIEHLQAGVLLFDHLCPG